MCHSERAIDEAEMTKKCVSLRKGDTQIVACGVGQITLEGLAPPFASSSITIGEMKVKDKKARWTPLTFLKIAFTFYERKILTEPNLTNGQRHLWEYF